MTECVIRSLDFRANWVRNNQSTIFGASDGFANSQEMTEPSSLDGDRQYNGSPSFLPNSFTGSGRHLRSLARNALCIVSELGPPTMFITLTCNQKWPEILQMLPEKQTAYDRPDIAVIVFKSRLKGFLSNLKCGKYFDCELDYMMYVIEYQLMLISCADLKTTPLS